MEKIRRGEVTPQIAVQWSDGDDLIYTKSIICWLYLVSIFPPSEVDVLGILMKRMSQSFQRHVEGSVPGNNPWGSWCHNLDDIVKFGSWVLSHVCWLVHLPDLGLGDLVIGMRNQGVGHVSVGLIVSNVFVGEFVVEHDLGWLEWVESAVSFVVHGESEEHDPWSSVEVTDGKLGYGVSTSLRRR